MKMWALFLNSYREYIRDKFVLVSVFIAVALFALSQILSALSFDEKIRIVSHFGFLAIYLSGMGIALFLGATTLQKELDKQTCLLVLARPVSRAQFLVSKFLAILGLVTVVDLLLFVFVYFLVGGHFSFLHMLLVLMGTWFEQIIILALMLLASTAIRSSIAIFSGIGVVLIGHWVDSVSFFANRVKDPVLMFVSETANLVFPNLYKMNWRSVYFLEKGIITDAIAWSFVHTLGWVLLALALAQIIFRRKDLV